MEKLLKAIVLSDNLKYDGLQSEWGLSIYLEYGEKNILLDTGASGMFADNAAVLGINIADVDYAVLSHAHYDHSNGMVRFFTENKKAKFYLRSGTEENCYKKGRLFKKYIGLPKGITKDYADRIEYVSGDFKLCDGVYLIPHKTPGLDKIGEKEKMFRKTSVGWMTDDFSHEQSLVIETEKGLVIFNSCSHGGAANIINEVAKTFPEKKVYGIIGGFHLYNKSETEIRDFASKIKETGIEYVCTGHCTGTAAYDILQQELRESLHQLYAGKVMMF